MRDGAARDIVQGDGAIHVVDVQFAVHASDHDVSGVQGTQLEGSMNGNGNGQVDGAHERIAGDAHFVVFFFHGKARSRNRDALHGRIRARRFAVAGAGLDDNFLAVVALDGDSAV